MQETYVHNENAVEPMQVYITKFLYMYEFKSWILYNNKTREIGGRRGVYRKWRERVGRPGERVQVNRRLEGETIQV